jgi:hypothetical protein
MKRTILTILTLLVFFTVNAQTISEIKNSSEPIDGRMINSFYKHDISQFKKIRSILKLDVFEYYELNEQYDSDLKKKVFKESNEYKLKRAELEKKKTELKLTSYFLDFEPTYYERNNLIKYDMTSKTFKVDNEIYLDDFYNKPNYLQFDQIIFKCPIGITVGRKQFESGSVDFINQSIKFKIESEVLALKIEENRSNLRLLFVFKFTDALPFEGLDFFGRKTTLFALANTLEKVILYNSKTGEIYYTYK